MSRVLPDSLHRLVVEVVQEAGLELFDLELNDRVMQVFLQSDKGVTIETCARVSQMLSARLDQIDAFPGRYFLEVSSPGLERKLRGISDFEREVGKRVHVVTSRGGYDGMILRVDGTMITLAVAGSEKEAAEITFSVSDVRRANLKVPDDELFARKSKPGRKRPERRPTKPTVSPV
jgi:ribosome maturation factor RimP